MNCELWISFKYLLAKRQQKAISAVTLFSVLGVGAGVMALIVVIAVMTGFAEDLKQRILGVTAHVEITGENEGIQSDETLRRRLLSFRGVVGASPFIHREAILRGSRRATGVVVRGLDPRTAGSVLPLERILKRGDVADLDPKGEGGDPGIILGRELMNYLGAGVGDSVVLISSAGALTPWGRVPKWKRFRVKGFFESGYWEFDYKMAYVSLSEAQVVFGMSNRVTGIQLRVEDIYATPGILRAIQASPLGSKYRVQDWMQKNRNLLFALGMEKRVMFVILFCIVGVAALLIISILVMMVMEKRKDIAILRAMGARSAQIMRIFLFQGFFLGLGGTLLGGAGGLLLCANLERLLGWVERTFGFQFLPNDVYYVNELPSRVSPWDVGLIIMVTLLISLGASVYPSWRAARMDPVEGIRYE